MIKLLVINGPNLNMLGIREPDIYGKKDYSALCEMIEAHARKTGCEVEIYQSNHEGDIVDKIQEAYGKADGIVINPAAYTHTSIAIPDAIKAVGIPAAEVHISDVSKREDFRKISYVRDVCDLSVIGHGLEGYTEAMDAIANIIQKNEN